MKKSIFAAIMVVAALVFTGCGSGANAAKVAQEDLLVYTFSDTSRGLRLMLDTASFNDFIAESDVQEFEIQTDMDGRFVNATEDTFRQMADENINKAVDEVASMAPNMLLIFAVGEYKTGAA